VVEDLVAVVDSDTQLIVTARTVGKSGINCVYAFARQPQPLSDASSLFFDDVNDFGPFLYMHRYLRFHIDPVLKCISHGCLLCPYSFLWWRNTFVFVHTPMTRGGQDNSNPPTSTAPRSRNWPCLAIAVARDLLAIMVSSNQKVG